MNTVTEIKVRGVRILAQHLGDVEAERFIALTQREPFHYTEWRRTFIVEETVVVISRDAMALRDSGVGADS